MFGPAIGEVTAAGPGPETHRPGTLVQHLQGWRDLALVDAAEAAPLSDTLPDPVHHFAQGSAPYGALTRLAPVHPGDTVLVTGAAGAVGTLAGQIARFLGAATVIGTTGSPHKAERLRSELGYDTVLLRGGPEPFDTALAKAAPDGVDVVLDNVGGDQLAAAVRAARRRARFALVGAVSGQLAPDGSGVSSLAALDTYRIVNMGLSLRGYSGLDHPDVPAEWTDRFGAWLRSGAITFPHTRIPGMEQAPEALQGLLTGQHFGAVVVDVDR